MSALMVATVVDRGLRRLFPRVTIEVHRGPDGWYECDRLTVKLATHVQPAQLFEFTCVLPPHHLYGELTEGVAEHILFECLKELALKKPTL